MAGKEGQDTSAGSHVTYGVEEEGYTAGDGTRSGPTVMQKLREKVSDYEHQLKGTSGADPHPELAYIPPGDGGAEQLHEGKQHGGVPSAALGHDVPAHETTDYVSSVKHDKHEGHKKHLAGEGADEPTALERIRQKVTEAGNHLKGTSGVDPHPELAYIPPQPQEHQPGFFSKMEHKFGAPQAKGTGSTDVGTGYEEDSEDALNPAVVPKYDEGVKP